MNLVEGSPEELAAALAQSEGEIERYLQRGCGCITCSAELHKYSTIAVALAAYGGELDAATAYAAMADVELAMLRESALDFALTLRGPVQ